MALQEPGVNDIPPKGTQRGCDAHVCPNHGSQVLQSNLPLRMDAAAIKTQVSTYAYDDPGIKRMEGLRGWQSNRASSSLAYYSRANCVFVVVDSAIFVRAKVSLHSPQMRRSCLLALQRKCVGIAQCRLIKEITP